MADRITSFEQLHVWQESISLAVDVYEITKSFPDSENFGITSQIRRSASSVSANIAEGFGRNGKKEKLQFVAIAYGSLLETKSFLYLANRLGYFNNEQLAHLLDRITILQKQLNSFSGTIKRYGQTNY